MKRMTCFVMALALVLGLAQCKKEQLKPENEGEKVTITLDVKGDDNAKVNVNPPNVTFQRNDEIQVACDGHHVGTLKGTKVDDAIKFIGDLTNVTPGHPLYFYFFGNVTPQYFGTNKESCTVYIGEQTGELPVISMGPSIDSDGNIVNYTSGVKAYTARLHNKCSLMKFNVTTASTAPVFIKGMNNFVEVNFEAPDGADNGFSYSQKYDGLIKMDGVTPGNTETWAIVLPQDPVGEGDAYTENGYKGTRPAIGEIDLNKYYSDGVAMTLEPSESVTAPLTFEAKTAGATVRLSKAGSDASNAPDVNLYTSTDGITWTPYTVGTTTITLTNVGDKVMFHGTNPGYATGTSAYHNFSLEGECYVYGNIMSLIDADDYVDHSYLDTNESYTFVYLFDGCEGLYNHSQKPLVLPAIVLTNYCYSHMFRKCTNMTVAPELLVDDLKNGCYQGMFEECTSLEESPVLHATKLFPSCYSSMFLNCSNLSHVTCFAEEGINVSSSTSGWLSGAGSNVSGTKTFTRASGVLWEGDDVSNDELTDGQYWPTGNNGIPNNWSVNEY